MPDRPSADRTAVLLLWFHREPSRYRNEGRRRNAPVLDAEVVLKLALGRQLEFADPVLNEPGTASVLGGAAVVYVRELFFRPDATPYQTLGLTPGASAQEIKESFRLLMQLVHPDRQDARALWPDSYAAQVNRAYAILRDEDSRAKFDREAEARAAVARAVHRAAAANAASMMPTVRRPAARFGQRSVLARALWPEWLSSTVGGYAREHPATVAFSVLIVGAVLAIAATLREGPEDGLVAAVQALRTARSAAVPEAPAPRAPEPARVPEPDPAAGSVAGADRDAGRRTSPAPVVSSVPAAVPVLPTAVAAPVAVATASVATAPAPEPQRLAAARATSVAVPVAASVPVVPAAPAVPAVPVATTAPPAQVLPAPPAVTWTQVASPAAAAPVAPVAAVAAAPPTAGRTESGAPATVPSMLAAPPSAAEIEVLFAAFVESYERGRLDALAALFDDEADTNLRHGRAAIRGEYDELFRLSEWRKVQLTRINWRRSGERAYAKGEIAFRIGWRDGREVEQRVAVDMELVRRDGRAVIAKLSQQAKNP